MNNNGIKVRVFDMEHGLREYEDIKIIRIYMYHQVEL